MAIQLKLSLSAKRRAMSCLWISAFSDNIVHPKRNILTSSDYFQALNMATVWMPPCKCAAIHMGIGIETGLLKRSTNSGTGCCLHHWDIWVCRKIVYFQYHTMVFQPNHPKNKRTLNKASIVLNVPRCRVQFFWLRWSLRPCLGTAVYILTGLLWLCCFLRQEKSNK
jgi:hypothetical protein